VVVPEPEVLADAVDSARIAVWQPAEATGDTLHHSAFYDSVLSYVRQSVEVERQKREYAQALSALTPLTSAHLESNRYRRMAIDSLSRYPQHEEVWAGHLDAIFNRYSGFARRTLDTLYHDSIRYVKHLPDIVRRDIFYPAWRPQYDSVESSIVARTLDVLHLIDSNPREITFKEDIRFEDPSAADSYDALRKVLDSLGREEQRIGHSAR
jgi:hypothetical protein